MKEKENIIYKGKIFDLIQKDVVINDKIYQRDIIRHPGGVGVLVTKEGKMKAVVSITIDDEFVVHDIKVIEGDKGLFIAMPSRKATDGEYRDIAHPINSETRDRIQNIILDKYEQVMSESVTEEAL